MKLHVAIFLLTTFMVFQPCKAQKNTIKNIKAEAVNFYKTVDEIGAGKSDISTFDNIASLDFKAHLPGGAVVNREDFKNIIKTFSVGFPGATHKIEDVITEGNKAVVRMTWTGIHKGTFQNIPATGNNISMSEMGILVIENGKVTEFYPLFDSMALMEGIGAVKK